MQSLKMLLLLTFLCIPAVISAKANKTVPVLMRAARGLEATLPCGPNKIFLDGPDSYVIWMKDGLDYVYRYPSEELLESRAARDYTYGIPCESKYCQDKTSFVIKKTSNLDQGLYRCRIHYQASPSVDYAIQLKIVEFTGVPMVFGNGEWLNKGFVGPLPLGAELSLICEVDDKDPKTEIYWRRDGSAVAHGFYTTRPGKLRVSIHLRNLSRVEVDARYQCLSQNADVTEPLSVSISIKMYLPPLSVQVRMNNNSEFEAGQPRVVDCVVIGCKPPPVIIWTLGTRMIRPSVHKELHDGNYTVSSLSLSPYASDHRKQLVCSVRNSFMPDSLFQDKVTLNVGFRPICQIDPDDKIGVVVGETETVECVVDSYPEPLQFTWTFANSKTLYTSSIKMPLHHNRYTSSMTWLVREDDIGLLICRATNAFGEQKKPCIFNITAGGPPELPECNVHRIIPNSLKVQCKKGWDGGRPQIFHLDIVDENGTRINNVTDLAGRFNVDIVDKPNITAILYASNSLGKSKERTIYLRMTPMSKDVTDYIQSHWMPYFVIALVIIVCAIAACLITPGIKILKARRCRKGDSINPDIVSRSDGYFHREPDFFRDERLLSTRNITVSQISSPCLNMYTPPPTPECGVLSSHGPHSSTDTCPSSLTSYYV